MIFFQSPLGQGEGSLDERITQHDALELMSYLGEIEPNQRLSTGTFMTRLIELLLVCDGVNLRKMSEPFPGLALAVDAYKNTTTGVYLLRALAVS